MIGVEAIPRGFAEPKQWGFVKPHCVASEAAQCGFEVTLLGFVKPQVAASARSMLPQNKHNRI